MCVGERKRETEREREKERERVKKNRKEKNENISYVLSNSQNSMHSILILKIRNSLKAQRYVRLTTRQLAQ